VAVQLITDEDAGQPRRARPKVLDTEPSIYRPGGAPSSMVVIAADDGSGGVGDPSPPTGVGFTTEIARHRPLADVLGELRVDARVADEAARIAGLLSLRRRRTDGSGRGRSRAVSARYDGNGDDLDLDATLDLLAERRAFSAGELTVRRPTQTRRSVALLADVSGSMTGEKALVCAAAIGALATELADDELTVIAFWSDLALLRTRASRLDPKAVLNDLLRIEPRGLTNVHGAIELASRELARSSLERRCIVLLSDCVHNAGPDPRNAARVAPTTHVLLERTGEHDAWLAQRMARAGGGRYRTVTTIHEVAHALDTLLGP
jgi:Mg-chelatase subunit ChlD